MHTSPSLVDGSPQLWKESPTDLVLLARQATSATVLAGVLCLVIVRPRGLHIAWPAGAGAAVLLALGLVSLHTLGTIFDATWNAAATLIALFLLAETLASTGMFTWAALHLARVARGSGWRLYTLFLLLTLVVTALLANDGAVLMLTPIFLTLLTAVYPDRRNHLPYLFATGFLADALSGVLVPSNLTNIIFADATRLNVGYAALWMALPTLAALATAGLAFALRFRATLGTPYDPSCLAAPTSAITDVVAFRAGGVVLVLLLMAYGVATALGLPVSLGAGAAALCMLVVVHRRRLRPVHSVLLAAPWSILVFALSMFVVLTAAFRAHDLSLLVEPLRAGAAVQAGLPGALGAGTVLALLAGLVNNLPATLVGVLALRSAGAVAPTAILAMMLGVAIGPKLTPFGSLATLLWMNLLARGGVHISWGRYLRENWWVTLLTLLAAFAGLAVAARLLGG